MTLIRCYYNEIGKNNAVLVDNEDKNGIKNYISRNSFLEIGFVCILNEKIFLLSLIPEISYRNEIVVI